MSQPSFDVEARWPELGLLARTGDDPPVPLDTDACGLQVFTQNWSVSRTAYTNRPMHGRMICIFSTCATAISFFPTSRRWRSTV